MGRKLKGRSFLTLRDYSAEEIEYLVDLAIDLKEKKKKGIFERHLANKNVALIFEKPSTRTRCSFTIGCVDEGAHPEYLGKDDIQLGHKETVEDTARVLGRIDVYKRQFLCTYAHIGETVGKNGLAYNGGSYKPRHKGRRSGKRRKVG